MFPRCRIVNRQFYDQLEEQMLRFPKARAEYAYIKADLQTNFRAVAENKCVEFRNQMLEYQSRCHELESRLAQE